MHTWGVEVDVLPTLPSGSGDAIYLTIREWRYYLPYQRVVESLPSLPLGISRRYLHYDQEVGRYLSGEWMWEWMFYLPYLQGVEALPTSPAGGGDATYLTIR